MYFCKHISFIGKTEMMIGNKDTFNICVNAKKTLPLHPQDAGVVSCGKGKMPE